MAAEPIPDAPSHHAEMAHFVTAAIAAMAVVPLAGCALGLGNEPGTEAWQNWLLGLVLIAGLYLLAVAFSHLGEAWRGADGVPPPVWSTVLRIALDFAVAGVSIGLVLRGPESRLLLAGLGDALPGLIAASGVSAGIMLYSRWREKTSVSRPPSDPRPRRGVFHILIAACLIAGLLGCELQPLPRITPAVEAAKPSKPE